MFLSVYTLRLSFDLQTYSMSTPSRETDGQKRPASSPIVNEEMKKLRLDEESLSAIITAMERMADSIKKELKSEISALRAEIIGLHTELAAKDDQIQKLRDELDHQQQYSRRSSIRISGIPEHPDELAEDTEGLVTRLGEIIGADVFSDNIDRCHMVGPKTNSNDRPIIVKFTGYKSKLLMMKAKKRIRTERVKTDIKKAFNTENIYFNEDLTKRYVPT